MGVDSCLPTLQAVPTDNAAAWDRHSSAYQQGAALPTDVAHYGPDIANETDLRLLGDLAGKRVLELGCGGEQASIMVPEESLRAGRNVVELFEVGGAGRAARLAPLGRAP